MTRDCGAPLLPAGLVAWELEVDGERFVLFEWRTTSIHAQTGPRLTASERDVLARVLRGQSNSTIAFERGRRPRTVANQVASLFRKLGVRSRAELVAHLARRRATAGA